MNGRFPLMCPNIPDDSDVRVEFWLHDVSPAASSQNILNLACLDVGFYAYANGELEVQERTSGSYMRFSEASRRSILVRFQRDISRKRYDVEIWDADGSNYKIKSALGVSWNSYTSEDGHINPFVTSEGHARLGFLRADTKLMPLGSRPPVPADQGAFVELKLDGDGKAVSENGVSIDSHGMEFVATPSVGSHAVAKTDKTPPWAPFRPLRAGHPSKLDGTASFSMSDLSSNVSCLWQQLEGPSVVIFDNRANCTPTVTGLVFGPYKFRLLVSDDEGNRSVKDIDTGAVAYDDNGVVIYPDERLYDLLGPTKVYGSNDWEWADERLTAAAVGNWEKYEINGGTWYAEDSKTSIAGLPRLGTFYIESNGYVGKGTGTNWLDVFCGGRVGPAVPGANIMVRMPTDGTGTFQSYRYQWPVKSCESDTQITSSNYWQWGPIAPDPGRNWTTFGLRNFRKDGTGTVYTSDSAPTKLYGIGTNFLDSFCGGKAGPISSAALIDVIENSKVTEKIVASCESDTELTITSAWNGGRVDSPGVAWGYKLTESGGEWRANNSPASTANYYDIALAMYTLYYRSGWVTARDSARWLAEQWWRLGTGWGSQVRSVALTSGIILHELDEEYESPLKNREEFWRQVEHRLDSWIGAGYCASTTIYDVRENAYCLQYVAQAAMFNPDPGKASQYREALAAGVGEGKAYTELQNPSGSYFSTVGDVAKSRWFRMANGSASVSLAGGEEIPANFCGDPATFYSTGSINVETGSTAMVANGGADFTGQAGKRVFIRGELNGQPYSQINRIASVQDFSHATLYYPWPGSNITSYRFQAVANGVYGDANTFGVIPVSETNVKSVKLLENDNWYWCTVDSNTQLTLDKPYTGDTSAGKVYRRLVSGFPGNGTSAFMNAIMAMAFFDAATALDGYNDSAAAEYRERGGKIVDYFYSWLPEPYGKIATPYYMTDMAKCYPRTSIPNNCDEYTVGISHMRSYSVEALRAFSQRFLASGSAADRIAGDHWYTAMFAKEGWESPFPGDGHHAGLLDNSSLFYSNTLLTKNTGQTFGAGGGQIWPAARLGGVQPPLPRTASVGFDLSSVPNATGVRIRIQSPSGGITDTECGATSPCSIALDKRQGAHWIRIEYLSAGGDVIARSENQLIEVP